jgi:hypothetical protein
MIPIGHTSKFIIMLTVSGDLTEAAGEPKHGQRSDALLLTLGSGISRQKSCHEEEGGEAKGMTGSLDLWRVVC